MVNKKLLSWVARGKQRRLVIRAIDGMKIVTDISKVSSVSLNNTSRVLIDFRKKEIAKCINPKEKMGRIYELTNRGKEIQKKLILS